MRHLTILVPDGQNKLSSIICTYKVFTKANAYWKGIHGDDLFNIQLAGSSDEITFYEGLFSVKPHTNISAITKTDLIIVSALHPNYQEAIEQNTPMIDWIAQRYNEGSEVASMCTGAFLLAASGLLDGKSCATHWAADQPFRTMFPKVNLQTDQLITDENGIYTNGGAFSFLNLIIYLVEKYYDRQTAIYCSKLFQIEPDRNSQSPFTIFIGQKSHDDEVVQQAQAYIENNLNGKISIEQLAEKFAVGRRSFDRRFIKATGNTPLEYAQRVKIESAKKAFETSRKTINEVMYEVGYSDVKAFREVFRKITGMSPLEYRSKYNKEALV
ncbi:MAG: AraC family transcriptional regulator [Candidatus Fluviicola riflensis]|nr:MAG: AraC family transcriptional regulator [Candidatus Fluviicola riflensis]OGS77765.1 MAG: AraC family transcriptional regulator [Candidatus Fluviicola riflensis]OGS84348.1 MAG: AraC family transcriptional regulator [Fluviicola sp. RIFCSPHIGHO2_12_FULL_43_24]OGS84830.1 MAG: AraC family transcriptional regulator [Fluviicola sp. RIFCSPHIGHO2_01_FULL_43_53]